MQVRNSTMAAIRFGYGFHPGQTPPNGAEDLISSLRRGASDKPLFPTDSRAKRGAAIQEALRARKRNKGSAAFRNLRKSLRQSAAQDGAKLLLQRALSPHGFFERLAAFWMDHFAVAISSPMHRAIVPDFERTAIRPHVTGRFADLLIAVVQHPAMLIALDQPASVGPGSQAGQRRKRGLNENLAREVLELHTLGVDGPYTQADVREFAELLTGYGVNRETYAFQFAAKRAEPGAEAVLGERYGGDPARADHAVDLLEDLAVHPATADHVAGKLVTHFVADTPDPDHVRHVSAAWRRSGGDLPAVYSALLDHEAAWRGFGGKVKQPIDLVASTLRAMGLTRAEANMALKRNARQMVQATAAMNQPLLLPPGPQGWPDEAKAWITPQGLAARLKFASRIGLRLARLNTADDPRRFAETALQDALRPETAFAVGGAPDKWEGYALAIASPEFNRR